MQTFTVPPLTKGAYSSLSPQPEQLHHQLSPAAFTPLAMLLKIPLTLTLLHVACLRDSMPWPGPLRHSFHAGTPAACKGLLSHTCNKSALLSFRTSSSVCNMGIRDGERSFILPSAHCFSLSSYSIPV